jgi:hypothetical protein
MANSVIIDLSEQINSSQDQNCVIDVNGYSKIVVQVGGDAEVSVETTIYGDNNISADGFMALYGKKITEQNHAFASSVFGSGSSTPSIVEFASLGKYVRFTNLGGDITFISKMYDII